MCINTLDRRAQASLRWDDLAPRVREALRAIEVPECGCKESLLPVCLIGAEAGCRLQNQAGNCACRWRYLPACQFDRLGGCALRLEGKRCDCGRMWMPECLSPGCRRRRRGKLCGCPRWPGEPCEHLTGYLGRMRMCDAARILRKDAPSGGDPQAGPDAAWAWFLWSLWPEAYRGPAYRGVASNLTDRETRVAMMELRHAAGLQLTHPGDRVHADRSESPRRFRRNLSRFVARLERPPEVRHAAIA